MSEMKPNANRPARPATTSRPAQPARPRSTAAGRPASAARPHTSSAGAARRPAAAGAAGAAGARRPAPAKKRKRQKKNPVGMIALVLVLVIALGATIFFITRGGSKPAPQTDNTANNAQANDANSVFASYLLSDEEIANTTQTNIKFSIKVNDLSINPDLDSNWLNILLLGADARKPSEPARTDTMMILSINKTTGSVKLTSLMRDMAVNFEGHKNARFNTAYYYGGERLAMKVVNENFGMNIQDYVYVDFSGFASIAEILGGIDIGITDNEAAEITENVKEQYWILYRLGRMDPNTAAAEYQSCVLTKGGENVHLNGMQTLGYARIRKLDSDYARAERQRRVLNLMMAKLQKASVSQLMTLYSRCLPYFRSNLQMKDIVDLASVVLNRSDFRNADELRLPVAGTYKEERRNNDAMLYDVDYATNKRELYNFIYVKK